MKSWRPLTWLLLSVACFIASYYFWRLGDEREAAAQAAKRASAAAAHPNQKASDPAPAPVQRKSTTVKHESTAPVVPPLNPVTNAVVTRSTNFPYRLSNTTQTMEQLRRNPKAILLENALIDLSQPMNLAIPDKLRAQGDPGSYIVQANGPSDKAFQDRLKASGFTIVSYFPNNAFLVTGPAAAAAQFGSSAIPWEPYYKVKASLMPIALAGGGAAGVNVAVFPNKLDETMTALNKLGVTVVSRSRSPFGTELALQNVSSVADVAALSGIELVEPTTARQLENDWSRVLMGVSPDFTTPTNNYLGLYGANVTVEVNDSWVPTNAATKLNPDLPNLFGPPSIFPPVTKNGGIADFDGHATHVAGCIAATGNNGPTNVFGSPPGANFRGKAPQANIYAMPLNEVTDAQLQEAAGETNVLISNNSWGYPDNTYNLAAASYDEAVRDSVPGATGPQSLVYVFAAGNDGSGDDSGLNGLADSLTSPAVAKNVISVGASELPRNITNSVFVCDACNTNSCTTNQPWLGETDSSNQVASFSSRGNVGIGVEGESGRFKPDVVAPGTFVVSTRSMTWDTNAYYNPVSVTVQSFFGDTVATNSVFNYSLFVPCDSTQLVVTAQSFGPPNVPLPIYVNPSSFAGPAAFVALGTNFVSLPPAAALTPVDATWFYAIQNITNQPVQYNTTAFITETDPLGDYFTVLGELNNELGTTNAGPNGDYLMYRYETGTSMAAGSVSGVLACMEDYFSNRVGIIPSPALMKALLINGARSINPQYDFQVQSSINYQGWGMPNLTNSLPVGIANGVANGVSAPMVYVDQDPNNALATGQRRTFNLSVTNDADDHTVPLRFTLVWTDPPGNPAASIKLVNNLELIVTNTDDPTNPVVYFGNDFDSGNIYTTIWDGDSNNIPYDTINNVQNIYIPQPLGTNYTITVFAKAVNVNAVTLNTNGIVQDFALVASMGLDNSDNDSDEIFTFTSNPIQTNIYEADLTDVTNEFPAAPTVSGGLLVDQHVGASSPLQGTNTLGLGLVNQDNWGTNGQITLGVSNQWHFYVITNSVGTNATVDHFTNALFATFLPTELSIPPVGVNAPNVSDATRPEADIDLYVARGPNAYKLTNLDPATVAAADKSLGRGGTELIVYTNAVKDEVFYVGVKSEDQEAAEYAFAGLFSQFPFSQLGPDGSEYLQGINVPNPIHSATSTKVTQAITLAVAVQPINVRRVVVTNIIQDQNFGDLVGTLAHGGYIDFLNNHSFGNGGTNQFLIYEDNGQGDIPGSRNSDGPGSLTGFIGKQGVGLWLMTEYNNANFNEGQVNNVFIKLEPQQNGNNGVNATIQPHTFFYDYIDVPPEGTNLTICVSSDPQAPPNSFNGPVELFVRYGALPTQVLFDYMRVINPPGSCLTIDRTSLPPLNPGRYYVGIYNPNGTAQTIHLSWTIGLDINGVNPGIITSTNVPMGVNEDAVTNNSIFITNQNQNIASINVGVVLDDPRLSDYDLTLVSPTGQRILLFENRGGGSATSMGHLSILTNYFGQTTPGGANANTNVLSPVPTQGTLFINYNMYTVPDRMDVYYEGVNIFSTVSLNPPTGLISGSNTAIINYPPPGFPYPATNDSISIVMNQGNNPVSSTQWVYTPYVFTESYTYLTFTDDTNLTDMPIKYAIPPYDNIDNGTNIVLGDFDQANARNFVATPAVPSVTIPDAAGGWLVTTNDVFVLPTNYYTGTNLISMKTNHVTVVRDPSTAAIGSNFLALAGGSISRVVSLTPERDYTISYLYRGPGIGGWWRGEGNGSDSADPETLGNNGDLIGRFNFPAGEVGQAFAMEDSGTAFEFAGTNTYVQVRQSGTLNVASNSSGFTVEGWINPTNTTFQQPVVEWLAHVPIPTNSPLWPSNAVSVSNLVIEAGPFLNRETGHYYYLLGQTDWITSEQWAIALGGHLADVNDANEENWIYDTFAQFGLTNHTMWIGLTNASLNGTSNFVWSSGASLVYSNWAAGQPTNCTGVGGEAAYVAILGPTNALPGLWTVLNNQGVSCTGVTNAPFGVVEVNEIQTNGVQLWISVTNSVASNNLAGDGRLYANIMDTNNVPHEVFSDPGLIQSNVFQHVALTYNTNTGIAKLYYDGTNVVTTNIGVFVPNTGGDLLIGKDMSRVTNNFFWGLMDEMSIYSRFLSDAEIAAIYNVSASTTNRNIGKFNPAITPALSLAEAQSVFGSVTNFLFGVNQTWQVAGFSFKPTSNTLPIQITGLEPGVLLDDFTIVGQPPANLYYLPEQALNALVGSNAFGSWTLEIRDSRTGQIINNATNLISWELQLILTTNTAVPITLSPQTPASNVIPPGEIGYFLVNVPSWANWATNILVSSTNSAGGAAPVSMIFNQTAPPLSGAGTDYSLLVNSSGGIGNPILQAIPPSVPPLLPGQAYYLGITNAGTQPAFVDIQVDFNITTLTNGLPFTAAFTATDVERPYVFNVDSNATAATFQLLQLTGNADLVLRKGLPLPSLTSSDYGAFSGSNSDETIYVLTNSAPVPVTPGPWYLDVANRSGAAMNYAVLAKELTNAPATNWLVNRVPFTWTAGSGTALTNFFRFAVSNFTGIPPTNITGVHFEVYNMNGNGDLTVQTNDIPLAPPFFQSSRSPSQDAEYVFIHTNSALTNLALDWFLGVPNDETNPIKYTILGVIDTNNVIAFPNAEGAGSVTRGGSFGTNVYHVITLSDSGAGSLRYGVTLLSTNGGGTIVFDVAGTITLASPLYITNSNLTIAGQTAPPGGITIDGDSTYVQNAQDVIIRYLRFRPIANSIYIDGNFDNPPGYVGATFNAPYNFGGWLVTSGSIDAVPNYPVGWQSAYGSTSIDMNGTTPGTISRAVPTIPGKQYNLRFAYSANPGGGPNPKTMQVSWGGTVLGTITAFTNGLTFANMNWQYTNFPVVGTGSDVLQFASTTFAAPTQFGPTLDAVSVTSGGTDSLQITNSLNVIIDHISAEYGTNDLVSVLNSSNVTVQWSVLAEALNTNSTLTGGSEVRFGSGDVTLHHNLYANNYSASPRIGDDITLDFVNNVIFNWGAFAGLSTNDIADDPGGFTNYLNYSANYLIAWTNSTFTNVAFWGGTPNTWIFQTNNMIDTNLNMILDGANTSWGMFSNQFTEFSAPFIINPTAPDEAFIAYERVLDFAGTAIGRRDATDQGIVREVRFEQANTNTAPAFLSDMVSWWKAESNALDSIGGNNGTLINGATFEPGEVNTAFSLNGTNSYVLVQTANSSLNVGVDSGMTIEGWINPVGVSREQLLFEWERILGSGSGSDVGALFFIEPTGTLYANIESTTFTAHTINSPANALTSGVWQHVAVTYDTNSGITALYVNGAIVASQNFGSFTPQTSYTNLVIGARTYLGSKLAPISVFGGGMDEFSIYSRALSACEIQAIYNSGTNGKAPLLISVTNPPVPFSLNPPFADADKDGIPDFWEITLGENPTNFSPTADYDGDGYTDLEDYLNWLAGPHALTVTNNPIAVDLYSVAGETGNLTFGVQNGTNGTVYLTNSSFCSASGGDTIAIFTPTNNFGGGSNGGFGSFSFMVTNTDTVAYFGPVTVSVFCSSIPITNANVAPFIFTNPPDVVMLEDATDQVMNAAVPTNGITYMLLNPPPWVTINPNSGLITLTPGECDSPTNVTIFTVATDTNVPPDSLTNQFNVTVLDSNLPPTFIDANFPTNAVNMPILTNYAGATILVTNTGFDPDCAPNPLGYLVFIAGPSPTSNLVNNASIDTNGVITWTPTGAQLGLFTVTTVVTNIDPDAVNATSLAATNYFQFFIVTPPPSFVFTQPAQAVTGASAQLNGMATPDGASSVAWFQWGTNTSYGNQTPPVSVGSGFSVVYTNAVISGLTANVPYHFRMVMSNALGVVTGFDQILDEAFVAGWGADYIGQISIPAGLNNMVAVAGAYDHSLALRNNETAVAWGDNTFGQTNIPPGYNNNILAIAGGQYYSIALRNGGSVVSWGGNLLGQTNVPAGLSNVVMIAGGTYASFALQSVGLVSAWGGNFFGVTNPPVGLSNVVEVAGGSYHAVAIRNDGTLAAWGDNSANQTAFPANATNVVQIACGDLHSLALRGDGTVVAWGDNSSGQTNVPPGLSNVVAVTAGGFHSLALKSDGSLVGWGDDSSGQISIPLGFPPAVAISAGYFHNLALTTVPFSSLSNLIILSLTNCEPETNAIPPGQTVFYQVNVPGNADFATNSLYPVTGQNLNVFFTSNTPPTITNVNDFLLLANTNQGAATLSTTSTPAFIDNNIYYLGVQNTNNVAVAYGIGVEFHFVVPGPSTNTAPISIVKTNIGTTNGYLLTWFAPSNDLFNVEWTSNLTVPVWTTFTNPPVITFDTTYGSINPTNTRFEFFDDGSQTGGFGPVRFYRVILLNAPASTVPLSGGVPQTNGIPVGSTVFYKINVPTNALFATNSLISVQGGNLNIWFSTNSPPTITNANDSLLIANASSGTSILGTNGFPSIVDGGTYYLGVQNTDTCCIVYGLSVNFDVPTAPAIIPLSITKTNIGGGTNGFLLIWFAPSNDLFSVQWSPSLLTGSWTTFNPTSIGYDPTYALLNATNTEFDFLDDGSQTGGFGPARFYRLILLNSGTVVSGVIPLTNGIALNYTTAAGGTNFFSFDITQSNAAVLFELYNLTGNGNLNLQRGSLPITPPYFTNSGSPATNYQQIVLRTNGALPNINAVSWFLGVTNQSGGSINYTIRAVLPTNGMLISGLPIGTGIARSAGSNVLSWAPTVNGEFYQVLTNSSLITTNWVALTTNQATNTSTTFTDPNPTSTFPALFYRIVQVP